jgi:hypothetical protein
MSRFRATCRRSEHHGHGDVSTCNHTFTDPAAWQHHMAKTHRIYPARPNRILTARPGFRSAPVLSELAKRKPNPALGHYDLLVDE